LLVVDDEPGITRVIEIAAREIGFDVMSINDTDGFEKALATLRPNIIMLDVAMPGRDGLELIGHLSASNYPGQIVVMSGTDPRYIQMSSTIAKMRGLTVAATLAKPFRKREVTELLARLAVSTD
jgi:DNA-binding response OmpR family regulator